MPRYGCICRSRCTRRTPKQVMDIATLSRASCSAARGSRQMVSATSSSLAAVASSTAHCCGSPGRYVEVLVTTAAEPLTITGLRFHETHYPYEDRSGFTAKDPRLA